MFNVQGQRIRIFIPTCRRTTQVLVDTGVKGYSRLGVGPSLRDLGLCHTPFGFGLLHLIRHFNISLNSLNSRQGLN
ncbi:hypothetical protein D3C81_1922030 [compost metagenome]